MSLQGRLPSNPCRLFSCAFRTDWLYFGCAGFLPQTHESGAISFADCTWCLSHPVVKSSYYMTQELAGKDIEDATDLIGSVRDFISAEFNDLGIMPEKEFYPWIGCDDEDGQ